MRGRPAWLLILVVVALGLLWFARSRKEAPAPHKLVPLQTLGTSVPDTSHAGPCTLTECRFSPVMTAMLKLTSDGKEVLGIWHVPVGRQSVLEMKNMSPTTVEINRVLLSICLNQQLTALPDAPEQCRTMTIAKTDCYQGKPFTLKPGATCSLTLDVDSHPQMGEIEFETSMSNVDLMVIAK